MKLFTSKQPNEGDTRKRKLFAFLPTRVWDTHSKTQQWIWLERYTECEVYKTDWNSWSADKCWVTEIRYI